MAAATFIRAEVSATRPANTVARQISCRLREETRQTKATASHTELPRLNAVKVADVESPFSQLKTTGKWLSAEHATPLNATTPMGKRKLIVA